MRKSLRNRIFTKWQFELSRWPTPLFDNFWRLRYPIWSDHLYATGYRTTCRESCLKNERHVTSSPEFTARFCRRNMNPRGRPETVLSSSNFSHNPPRKPESLIRPRFVADCRSHIPMKIRCYVQPHLSQFQTNETFPFTLIRLVICLLASARFSPSENTFLCRFISLSSQNCFSSRILSISAQKEKYGFRWSHTTIQSQGGANR